MPFIPYPQVLEINGNSWYSTPIICDAIVDVDVDVDVDGDVVADVDFGVEYLWLRVVGVGVKLANQAARLHVLIASIIAHISPWITPSVTGIPSSVIWRRLFCIL